MSELAPDAQRAPRASPQFGLMRLDGVLLALPVDNLKEVVPYPEHLAVLPVPGLRGAAQVRGMIIPVLDLRGALGMEPVVQIDPVIVLMRYEGRLLGLSVSAVNGMACIEASKLQATNASQPTGASITTHTFEVDQCVISLLDAQRIANLPGIPMVEEAPSSLALHATAKREPLLLFASEGHRFGIASRHVEATVPSTVLRSSPLASDLCKGVIDHHEHEVPVIDTLALLGLGRMSPCSESAIVVLRLPEGHLGLMLEQVRDIHHAASEEIVPLQPIGLTRPHLFRGMLTTDDVPHLVIDGAAIESDPILASLASMSRVQRAVSGAGSEAQSSSGTQAFLTYRIEMETASPLCQVSEILPYPTRLVALDHADTLGLFEHRNEAVPLISLNALMGRSGELDPESARVLLVGEPGSRIGLAVQALCSIENAHWEQPAMSSDDRGSDAVRRMLPLVEVGRDHERRTLPRLDLLQIVRALRAEARARTEQLVETAKEQRLKV